MSQRPAHSYVPVLGGRTLSNSAPVSWLFSTVSWYRSVIASAGRRAAVGSRRIYGPSLLSTVHWLAAVALARHLSMLVGGDGDMAVVAFVAITAALAWRRPPRTAVHIVVPERRA